MDELVKIYEHKGRSVVSARELHSFLESKQEFSSWIKNRIENYGFAENVDYTSFDKIIKRENGATTRTEYAITLDMAKELSMVEKNEKGRIARKYFIERDKILKQVELGGFQVPKTHAEALRMYAASLEQLEEHKAIIEQNQPKVLFADTVSASDESILIGQLAKFLRKNGIKVGQNRLFEWMRKNGYLLRRGGHYNTPSQKSLELGLMDMVERIVLNPKTGADILSITPKITGKGQVYFVNKLSKINL